MSKKPNRIDKSAYDEELGPSGKIRVINRVSYLRDGEARILFDLYSRYPGVCVEIGARWGCSTMALALAIEIHGGSPLISIDPHGYQDVPGGGKTLDGMMSNLDDIGLLHNVIPTVCKSSDFGRLLKLSGVDPFITMLWIDGDHSERGVAEDLMSLHPFVVCGGVVCGHDYMEQPRGPATVKSAVDGYAARNGYKVHVDDTMWCWEKN